MRKPPRAARAHASTEGERLMGRLANVKRRLATPGLTRAQRDELSETLTQLEQDVGARMLAQVEDPAVTARVRSEHALRASLSKAADVLARRANAPESTTQDAPMTLAPPLRPQLARDHLSAAEWGLARARDALRAAERRPRTAPDHRERLREVVAQHVTRVRDVKTRFAADLQEARRLEML